MKYGYKNMKKYLKTLFAVFAVLHFSSCQVGLGPAVDIQAPKIELTSHKDNDSVAEFFTLTGKAEDNEGVTEITIDFDDADIHFKVEPGNSWFKKTSASEEWVVIPDDSENFCKAATKGWDWSVKVDTSDKIASKTDTTYTLTAVASDKAGNSGRSSKVYCSLSIDVESPVVSIQQPELITGDYSSIKNDVDGYKLNDGNVIAKLLNGQISISGRVDQSISFKGLRIDFDNGENKSGVRKSTNDSESSVNSIDDILNLSDVSLGDPTEPKIYCTKILEDSSLRNWTLTINPEDLTDSENGKAAHLETGKHIIRVVSTCLSASNAWERKVLGYFVWWPEADKPWITVNSCDIDDKDSEDSSKYTCYPGSNISGSCQDDDGIKTFISTIYKKENGVYVKKHEQKHIDIDSEVSNTEIVKYLAFSVAVPADNASYRIDFKVIDVNGAETSLTKYFKTSDVSAPKIEIIQPEENSTVIQNANGDISFEVKATDDGSVKTLALVWLNPAKANDVANKINYLTGNTEYWKKATKTGYSDENGNIIYLLVENGKETEEIITKTLNLYSDLGIDGNSKKLAAQEFILYASDGISNSIKTITLTGDTLTPVLSFDRIKIGDQDYSLETPPTFKKLTASDTKAVITGKWSDSFNSTVENKNKFAEFTVKWGNNSTSNVERKSDGTWSAELEPPATGGTITASLIDFAGNKKTVQSAASIETTDLALARIGCNEDDGAYTTGKVLNLTLEFTKNTDVRDGTPTLTLNNGGTATYVSGSGTPVHVYKYTIGETDIDVEKLSVTALNANGAKWYDSAVEKTESNSVLFSITESVANLNKTRTITIDKTKPTIKSITSLAAAGYYKEKSQIPLILEFSEDVTVENASATNLCVNFDHDSAKTSSTSVSGSKYVLFTYVVGATDNANPLTFSSISHDSVTIRDNAGNELEDWTPSSKDFTGIVIDTTKPSAPSFGTWSPLALIIDSNGTSFTLSGEDGATIEYSIDNGASWLPYTDKVTLKNNGTYNVTARQTDKAGNVSENAATKTFTIDAGDLLTKITAKTPNGTYSTNTSTKTIVGRIEFRKEVTIEQGATVTLNIGSGKTVPINECKISDGKSKEFTFTYEITEGDKVDLLDVTKWSFKSVKVGTNSVNISFPTDSAKLLSTNRNISILTGNPDLKDASISGTTLYVKYDRPISKLSGNIELEFNDIDEFRVPVVLSASEYNELKSNTTIRDSYIAGTNGAIVSGTTLVNDTTTKYILKTGLTDDDRNSALVTAFKTANKHKVTIPIIASEVSITGNTRAATGDTLTVDLSGTYKVPVKGAVYKLTIPANAVTDAVSNKNVLSNDKTVTAEGVEKPEIRIVKPKYRITIPAGSTTNLARTKNATVNINDMESATMYLNCRTPNATIKYNTNIVESTRKIINSNPIIKCESAQGTGTSGSEEIAALRYADGEFTTLTAGASIPQATETYTAPVTLKGSKDVSTYANANGLKIAIAAQASVGTADSELSYEYATRTVVKFMISNYRDANGSTEVEGTGTNTVYMRNLRMWLTGGDGTSGSNSNENTPISWTDTSKFMLMAGSKTYPTMPNGFTNTGNEPSWGQPDKRGTYQDYRYSSMYGNWWWVTWDITDATYIGFVAGNVPSDGATMGPDKWYCADYHWTTIKEQYPLYPGETLVMMAHGDQTQYVNAKFFWDNTEKLWYYSPYYAKFAFETKKYYTR